MTATLPYADFLAARRQLSGGSGFEPIWMPDVLMGFQGFLCGRAIRRGRAAIYSDCGTGKSLMQLVWGENVVRHTNRPVLIMTPLAVGQQTVAEAEKFGIEAVRSIDGKFPSGARIVVTNYERLKHFDPDDFAGAVCDESGCLRDFKSRRKADITEFMRRLPYRLLCTATPAPNDWDELGTSAECLGEMGYRDMITKFFRKEIKGGNGWARFDKYHLRPYAASEFWRWVASWATACRKPSDLGFDDGPFQLPELITREHSIRAARIRDGFLIELPARGLAEELEERRRTIGERCEKAAELVSHDQPAVCWCDLNPESSLLDKLIPGSVEVRGSDPIELKEEKLQAFSSGQARVLISKKKMTGYGLNWQHCAHQTHFPTNSFAEWYQAIRRSWRFGQTRPVTIDVIATEGGAGVLANLCRKEEDADRMFAELVRLMNDSLKIGITPYGDIAEEMPLWLR